MALMCMMRTYTTVQGEAWDEVAVAVYGIETEMPRLLVANPEYQDLDTLPANTTLQVPERPGENVPRSPQPPWDR